VVLAYPVVVGGFLVTSWKALRRADARRGATFATLAVIAAVLVLVTVARIWSGPSY
jgi:hypothetical protein